MDDKAALADALEQRAGALGKVLSHLRGLRAQLHGHMRRVNEVFAVMHESMGGEVRQDARSLEALGVAFGDWGVFRRPGARPIKPDHAPAPADDSALALLETEVVKAAAAAPAHVSTLDAVFANMKRAIALWEPMNADYGRERKVLTRLDAALGSAMDRKSRKLAALQAHARELRGQQSHNGTHPELAKAFRAVRQHATVMRRSCGAARHHADVAAELKRQIAESLGETSAATGATGAAGSLQRLRR